MRYSARIFLCERIHESHSGFTLIELLLVIGLLSILSTMVIISLLPKIENSRDAVRKERIRQFATALESYATTHNGAYPLNYTERVAQGQDPSTSNWIQDLIMSGDLKTIPSAIDYGDQKYNYCGATDANNKINNYCYNSTGPPPIAIVWTNLESAAERKKCPADTYGNDPGAYFVWSSYDNKLGTVCVDSPATSLHGYTFTYY
jgi:prepilin-type N-terminal cleavage/methylation domain-containing protein